MSWEHIDLAIDSAGAGAGAGAIATITLNRPDALNALSGSMREDLLAAINEAAAGARVLIITGAGKGFCSGGDVRFMAELRRESRSEALAPLIEQGKRVVQRLRDLPIPSVACVNGVAAGAGFGLALACDLRIASATARFAASFSRLGLHPDWGTSFFLTRLAGAAVARELIFTGRLIDAAEALRFGLVNRVVEPGALAKDSRELAEELAAAAPLSIQYANKAVALAEAGSLDEVLDFEAEAQLACFRSDDALEGIQAFEEKRRPQFKRNTGTRHD